MDLDPREAKEKLASLIREMRRRPVVTIGILGVAAAVTAGWNELVGAFEGVPNWFAKCDQSLRMIEANAIIRAHVPGQNTSGLKQAVEKVLCETGELVAEDLTQANLRGLDADRASFDKVVLAGADLIGADLTGVTFEDGSLSDAMLQDATAKDAVFRRTSFYGTILDCADLEGATFEEADFRNNSAQWSIMRSVTLRPRTWSNVNMAYADLRNMEILGTADDASNIYLADISESDMREFTEFFPSRIHKVFGASGACYRPGHPPFDSEDEDWRPENGALWRAEHLELLTCPRETVERTGCPIMER